MLFVYFVDLKGGKTTKATLAIKTDRAVDRLEEGFVAEHSGNQTDYCRPKG